MKRRGRRKRSDKSDNIQNSVDLLKSTSYFCMLVGGRGGGGEGGEGVGGEGREGGGGRGGGGEG